MKKYHNLYLSVFSGLLLFAAWPTSPFTFLIFIAFVPLLFVADNTPKKNHFFLFCFIALLLWNAATTWWIWNSAPGPSIAAFVCNALLMYLPWRGYHIFKQKFTKRFASAALVVFWMMFEYIHLNWQLTWPWLTLGNVFARCPNWVQWYEYTGVGGGTLWVLVVNILIKSLIEKWYYGNKKHSRLNSRLTTLVVIIVAPFVVSYAIQNTKSSGRNATKTNSPNVLIVQPNVDPYQKFGTASAAQQIDQLVSLSEQNMDTATKLVLWPETALSVTDAQNHIRENFYYKPVFDFADRHPHLTILSGIECIKRYGTEKVTPTARKASDDSYYDAFNAAIAIKKDNPLQFYNKSKLVPGVESLPTFLNFLGPLFEQFGGTTGGYGRNDSSMAISTSDNPFIMAPVICYESIYGEYVASYVQRGANLITILTNDGWWGNTPGHKQHLAYARLRAIETRRWVARSANTGISAVIDDWGRVVTTQPWGTAAVIKYNIPAKNTFTFYTNYGDYLFKIATVLGVFLITFNVWAWVLKRFTRK